MRMLSFNRSVHNYITVQRRFFFWGNSSGEEGEPNFSEERIFSTSRDNVVNTLSSVDKYREFLPWCLDSNLIKKEGNSVEVDLVIGNQTLKQKQKAILSMHHDSSKIRLSLVEQPESPVKYFTIDWKLKEISPNRCSVSCDIRYDFKSSFYRFAIGSTFQTLQEELLGLFEKRCKQDRERKE
eukprot:TRINITY_DN14297_c0_g1_i1.p1 TRINITY_DN14297_c0_g1~~TRINITY_DN14297_c0_g1_i1.p1  ORF type:complete len:182 (+),score=43.53 TRINITY_DN14297_c0_g1_i1:195-740(+)